MDKDVIFVWAKRLGAGVALIGLVLGLASLMPILSPTIADASPDYRPMILAAVLVGAGLGAVILTSVVANFMHTDDQDH